MSTQTPNYNFDLREGTDIFNPLSTNANWESLDTLLKTIQETGGITTYTTTASANLLKLSGTPVVNDTVFKFVAAGDANTWTGASGGVINKIVGLDGVQKKILGGNMYVAWVNAANSMIVVAWPDVVNAQTFDGKSPAEWATKAQLDAVNQTADNATQTAQAAATVANNALEVAQAGGMKMETVWEAPGDKGSIQGTFQFTTVPSFTPKFYLVGVYLGLANEALASYPSFYRIHFATETAIPVYFTDKHNYTSTFDITLTNTGFTISQTRQLDTAYGKITNTINHNAGNVVQIIAIG